MTINIKGKNMIWTYTNKKQQQPINFILNQATFRYSHFYKLVLPIIILHYTLIWLLCNFVILLFKYSNQKLNSWIYFNKYNIIKGNT